MRRVLIARTDSRFREFAPYVASIDDAGTVAFQAALAGAGSGAGSGVFRGSGGAVRAVAAGGVRDVISHPDINAAGDVCFYADLAAGGQAVLLARGERVVTVADTTGALSAIGPLGPTINRDGIVAFRADTASGLAGVFSGSGGATTTVALVGRAVTVTGAGTGAGTGAVTGAGGDGERVFSGFEGLPVVTGDGAVVFRAALARGGHGIYRHHPDGSLAVIAETGEVFAELARFPIATDAGVVAFCATRRDGRAGVFTRDRDGAVTAVVDTGGGFESVRGVLVDGGGRGVFYATPRGAALGIYAGPDPAADRVLAIGDPLDLVGGERVAGFALNPVSINESGQIAVRVELASGGQAIVSIAYTDSARAALV